MSEARDCKGPAYYNENDPRAAAWLRELIADGLIAAGDVDDRSICDVTASDVRGYRQCHFFAGVGGWSYALRLAGWPDDREVWTGSCPCQPFSVAGRGLATEDERHLWPEFYRLISECRPSAVFGEQVSSELGLQWLDGVFADLERGGYAVAGADLPAASVGAPHIRQRLYWVGHTKDDHGRAGVGTTEAGARQDGERGRGFAGSGPTGGVADSSRGGLGIDGCSSGRAGHADERGEVGGVGYPRGERLEAGRGESESGRAGRTDRTGEVSGVGNAASVRLERHPEESGSVGAGKGRTKDTRQEGRRLLQPTGAGSRGSNFWSPSLLLPCGDGKARRVKPGIFPLVTRLSGGVVSSGDPSEQEADSTAEARVMRLRGYGNAIVPPLAAEFIKAASSVLAGLR